MSSLESLESQCVVRILALLQRKTLIETKKSNIKLLKMVLFDRTINEKCCSVDGGRGICRLFFFITIPVNLPYSAKKMPMPRGQSGVGGGGVGCQVQVELTLEGGIAFRKLLTSISNTAFMENRLSFYKLILFICMCNQMVTSEIRE